MVGSGEPTGHRHEVVVVGARRRRFESCHPDMADNDVGKRVVEGRFAHARLITGWR
jgi:hypothetical protein